MAVRLPDIISRVSIDTSGLDRAKQEAGKFGDQAASKFAGVRKAAIGVGAAMVAMKGKQFLAGAIDSARESNKILAQTAQAIETTGGAANVTADEVGKLAGRLSKTAGVHDEIIQQGSNLLLTFKNVRNEAGEGANIFDRATTAALDLSAAGFGSMESASMQMGKALNDPIKGVASLAEAGVQFTDQQREQIRTMVESGNVLGAQQMILAEVEGQVAGSAAAQRDEQEALEVSMRNLKETIGKGLLPVMDTFAKLVTPLADIVSGIPTPIIGLGLALGGLAGGAVIGVKAAGSVAEAFTSMKDGALAAVDKLKGLDLSGVASNLGGLATTIKTAFVGAFTAVKAAAAQAFAFLAANPWILAIGAVIAIVVLLIKHWDKVKAAFEVVVEKVGAALNWLRDLFYDVINAIIGWFEGLINFWIRGVNTLIRAYNKIPFKDDIGEVGQVSFGRVGDQGAGGGGNTIVYDIDVNNPVGQTSQESIGRELRKQAILGIA